MPRSKMVEAFKTDVNSVHLRRRQFLARRRRPGRGALECDHHRLPFTSPIRPLLEAVSRRSASEAATRSSTTRFPRPSQAQARFRPADSHEDRHGIVVILDPRVLTKPYGKQFLGSLPEILAHRGSPWPAWATSVDRTSEVVRTSHWKVIIYGRAVRRECAWPAIWAA